MGRKLLATLRTRHIIEGSEQSEYEPLEKMLDPDVHLAGTVQDVVNYLLEPTPDPNSPFEYNAAQIETMREAERILTEPRENYNLMAIERTPDGTVRYDDLQQRELQFDAPVQPYFDRFKNDVVLSELVDQAIKVESLDMYLEARADGGM